MRATPPTSQVRLSRREDCPIMIHVLADHVQPFLTMSRYPGCINCTPATVQPGKVPKSAAPPD
eukprot:4028588-Prymnesium_polylepis.1